MYIMQHIYTWQKWQKWEFVHIAQCGGICDKMETLDITPT